MEFKNESGLEFSDISTELYREYEFFSDSSPFGPRTIRIDRPLKLNVSKSGGHRLFDENGESHYIPAGWVHLRWRVKDGAANFVK